MSRGHEKQNTIKKARYKVVVNLNRRPYLFKSTLVIEYADKRPAKFSSPPPPAPQLEKYKTTTAYLYRVSTCKHARDSIQPSQKGEAEHQPLFPR